VVRNLNHRTNEYPPAELADGGLGRALKQGFLCFAPGLQQFR